MPSCRSRSIRRRSASVASTSRARDAWSSTKPGAQLGLQTLVLQREARGRAHRLHELGVVLEHGIVEQHGDRLAVALDERRAPPAVGLREPDRHAVAIDVTASRPGTRRRARATGRPALGRAPRADPTERARFAQLDDEPGDHPARQPALQRTRTSPRSARSPSGEVHVRGQRSPAGRRAGRGRPSRQARRAWRIPPPAPARPRVAAPRLPAASADEQHDHGHDQHARRPGAGGSASPGPCDCRGPPGSGCSRSPGSAGPPCCRTASPAAGGRPPATTATATSQRSSRPRSRPDGNESSRYTKPMIHTDWTANPIVFSHGGEASTSCAANQANPVNTMIWPSRFSGRAATRQVRSPAARRPPAARAPARARSGGRTAGEPPAMTAPTPASTPAPATTDSFALI